MAALTQADRLSLIHSSTVAIAKKLFYQWASAGEISDTEFWAIYAAIKARGV